MTGIPPLSIGLAAGGEYVINIPDWTPTPLNKLLGSWRKAAKLKATDRRIIWGYSQLAKIPYARVKRSVELTVTLEPKQRSTDVDSLWKSLLDALVHCYALWDDTPRYCELLPVKFERGARKATRIVLRDVA
jgi:Holliday junction resolvase RusA-like endonuclease